MISIDRKTGKQLFYIGALSLILGVLTLLFHPRSAAVSWERPDTNSAADSVLAAVSQQNASLQEPLAINTRQARTLVKQGAVFIDARLPRAFKQEHIPGAVNIPFERMLEHQATIDSLFSDNWVITYCQDAACDLAGLLGWELFFQGFPNVAVYHPGLQAWKKAGYETVGKNGS